eukprot:403370985
MFQNKRIKNFKSEYQIMDTLNKFKFPGFPKLLSYGMSDNQNYIVTELLGPTLKDKLKEREGPFSMETVCMIGLQLIERLENFHNIGYIHLDLKPDNILLGSPDGLTIHWKYNICKRKQLSQLCLAIQSSMVKEQKLKLKGEEFCKDLPSPFATLFNYVRHLDFEQKPDYSYMKKGLRSIMDQSNVSQFDNHEMEQRNNLLNQHQTLNVNMKRDLRRSGTANKKGEPDQPQTPAMVSKPHYLGVGMGGLPHNIAQTPLLKPSKMRRTAKSAMRKKKKGKKSLGALGNNQNQNEEEEQEEEDDQNDHQDLLIPGNIQKDGPKSQNLGRIRNHQVLLTPNVQKSNLLGRREVLKQMNPGVGLRKQQSKKNLVTIRHATIYEVSHIDVNRRDVSARLQNNESFEVEFDSAEFNDNNIDEGFRPEYNHEFFHNDNNIKYLKARSNTMDNNMRFVPYISFF